MLKRILLVNIIMHGCIHCAEVDKGLNSDLVQGHVVSFCKPRNFKVNIISDTEHALIAHCLGIDNTDSAGTVILATYGKGANGDLVNITNLLKTTAAKSRDAFLASNDKKIDKIEILDLGEVVGGNTRDGIYFNYDILARKKKTDGDACQILYIRHIHGFCRGIQVTAIITCFGDKMTWFSNAQNASIAIMEMQNSVQAGFGKQANIPVPVSTPPTPATPTPADPAPAPTPSPKAP